MINCPGVPGTYQVPGMWGPSVLKPGLIWADWGEVVTSDTSTASAFLELCGFSPSHSHTDIKSCLPQAQTTQEQQPGSLPHRSASGCYCTLGGAPQKPFPSPASGLKA